MASKYFTAYDNNLRRMFMMSLVENLAAEQGGSFRASIVLNPRTGLPNLPELPPMARRAGFGANDALR